MIKNRTETKMSQTSEKSNSEELKESVDLLYEALSTYIHNEIVNILKDMNILQLTIGEVKGINKSNTKISLDIGDTTLRNILNKSDRILKNGDSVVLLNTLNGNYRNSFIICQNGEEKPLEIELENAIEDIENKIDAFTTS